MNRRGFLCNLLKIGVAPMVLPPALLYARKWKATGAVGLWTPSDVELYNKLPFYLARMQLKAYYKLGNIDVPYPYNMVRYPQVCDIKDSIKWTS